MAVNVVIPPYETFTDNEGKPLEAGYIFIGQPGFEAQSTPQASFFDAALTIPTGTASGAAVRTMGGFPMRNGSPAVIFVQGDYSITVKDRKGVILYSALTIPVQQDGNAIQVADAAAMAGLDFVQWQIAFLATGAQYRFDPANRTAEIAAGDPRYVAPASAATGASGAWVAMGALVTQTEFPSVDVAKLGYLMNAAVLVKGGETVKLQCNPTAGDDFQAFAYWQSSGHLVREDGDFFVEIADGLHNLTTAANVQDGGRLVIKGTGSPDFCTITGATFLNQNETQATATASVTAGEVTSMAVTLGGKYFSFVPAVTFAGGGGVGAAATALMSGGVVTGFTITNSGTGYATPPTVTIEATPAGEVYLATVTVSGTTPLPARVVPGWAVGMQNIQGDGAADLLNGALIVEARLSDTQFTALLRGHGVAPTTFAVPDSGQTLGLVPNQLVVTTACLRVNEAGWDGNSQEGFINLSRGAGVRLKNIAISYNGNRNARDIIFARDNGAEINFEDYVVIAGAGEMVVRTAAFGSVNTNRSCLGGGVTASNIWQGSIFGDAAFTRTMMGSVAGDGISASQGGRAVMNSSVLTGANQGVRVTAADASIAMLNSRLSRCLLGAVATVGDVTINDLSLISNCTSPISVSSQNRGVVWGNPILVGNTNAPPTPLAIQDSGGVWRATAGKPYEVVSHVIGRFSAVLNFPNTTAGTPSTLTISAPGVIIGDTCSFPARLTGAEVVESIIYDAKVSAPDVITVFAHNYSTGSIDPASATRGVIVTRSS